MSVPRCRQPVLSLHQLADLLWPCNALGKPSPNIARMTVERFLAVTAISRRRVAVESAELCVDCSLGCRTHGQNLARPVRIRLVTTTHNVYSFVVDMLCRPILLTRIFSDALSSCLAHLLQNSRPHSERCGLHPDAREVFVVVGDNLRGLVPEPSILKPERCGDCCVDHGCVVDGVPGTCRPGADEIAYQIRCLRSLAGYLRRSVIRPRASNISVIRVLRVVFLFFQAFFQTSGVVRRSSRQGQPYWRVSSCPPRSRFPSRCK